MASFFDTTSNFSGGYTNLYDYSLTNWYTGTLTTTGCGTTVTFGCDTASDRRSVRRKKKVLLVHCGM